jgi:hypothetical protein
MICNSGQIMKALDILPNVVRHPKKYVDHLWFHRNPEQVIKQRWIEENIWDDVRHFDRVMFTCAEEGDETRWKVKSAERAVEGVYLKYELEYHHTKCICSGNRWNVTETLDCSSPLPQHHREYCRVVSGALDNG